VPGASTRHDGGVTETRDAEQRGSGATDRNQPVLRAIQAYAERQPQLQHLTDRYVRLVTTLLDDAGINYLTITGRTKSVASFAAKAARAEPGSPAHEEPLTGITDQVGVRVVAYLLSEVEAVAELLAEEFTILDDRDMGRETASQGRFGYASRHLLISGSGRDPGLEQPASVQVRTILQHAWAEFEHDIRYKGTVPEEHAPDLDRRFTLAAGLLELADREFSEIRGRIQAVGPARSEEDATDPRISAPDLAAFLTAQYTDAGWSRTDHYAWISGLLLELGITSLDELAGLLTSVDSAAINARLEYKYPPGAVRRLDDALLAVFGNRYIDLHGNAHRRDLLAARLEKLRS
jgi:putative GTP pyrophosphokinase